MKTKILNLAYSIILFLQLDKIVRFLTRNKVTIISYHNPSVEVFAKHIQYLSRYYNFISLDEFMTAKKDKIVNTLPKNTMIVTLDDGHKKNAELFGICEKYQVKPTIYCCSNIVGTKHHYWWSSIPTSELEYYKHLDNKKRITQLEKKYGYSINKDHKDDDGLSLVDLQRLMKIGGIVGGHTRNHPILSKCDDNELEDEIIFSKMELEQKIGEKIRHFAYPNGTYTTQTLNYIERAGYTSARTTLSGWNSQKTNNYELKVLGISDTASLEKLRVTLTGILGMVIGVFFNNNY
ncbi:polysaccharide deacetylase family protein [Pasteurella skyensis]|uniref:Polysaccharide deacetylase family protein n=1 Tax=Phocoenobacter skyensis TaxID=97481 RepID=A0AAJ6NE33_9PAST|nr:polysaccharide deacetylase family protein [Pasteurella skyensis]MDP8170025.1 polysaccharide deacetylase family protein [Pasteurella skyensis]MDP8175104.1 polysaccharide deacetylase family protein [Pasteurella skyensis]